MWLKKRGKFIHYRFMFNGHLYRGSTKETGMGGARTFVTTLMQQIREGKVNPHCRKAPTLETLSVRFMVHIEKRVASHDLKPRAQRFYGSGIKLLRKTVVWQMRVNEIDRNQASELTFPGGGGNANVALRTLRVMLSYAEQLKMILNPPKIDLRAENTRDRIIEPWMETLLLEAARPLLHDVIIIMLDCGMRPNEVSRMEWEHIRWNDNTVLVPHGKTLKARRFVGMTERMRAVFEARKKGSIYVFHSPRAASQHVEDFGHSWLKAVKAANALAAKRAFPPLPSDIVLYSCRHTFATNFLRAGGDVGQLMRLMGHSSLLVTQRYVHLVESSDAGAVMDRHNETKLKIVKRRA